jgi:5,10-methylenetetrahydromethanopterin reductase
VAVNPSSVTPSGLRWSCAFYTGLDTPDHIALAERMGFYRAWVYDSPALCLDVWATLARAADRTTKIGLATGVIVPSLRHLSVTASAVAMMETLAPGRFTLGVGTGFTGLRALGHRPMRWRDVVDHVTALRALLRGEAVPWEGTVMRLLHPDGYLPAFPIEVPVYFATEGPKGLAAARGHADGVVTVRHQPEGFTNAARIVFGTVLDDGEALDSDRVWKAAGPGAVLPYHGGYETGRDISRLPNGAAWRAAVDALPAAQRHLVLHRGHLIQVSELDETHVPRAAVGALTFTGTVDQLRPRAAQLAAAGINELIFQPAGPDIPRELEAFTRLAGHGRADPARATP